MTTAPAFTTLAAGSREAMAALVTNYQCGSCGGEINTLAITNGLVHASITHEPGCPVLNGHVSSTGDLARAAGVPDTFRP